mmetsp:Transcript_9769/g.29698  ORF Transcript_9769/g.29698 Transcript_9769/m.29698 type:complete len:546 (+) Transcript_9769:213-1850(+)
MEEEESARALSVGSLEAPSADSLVPKTSESLKGKMRKRLSNRGSEKFVAGFSCALKKPRNLLYHGKLQVYEDMILFSSVVFGGIEEIYIPSEIYSIQRKPVNSLVITLESSDLPEACLINFANRPRALKTIRRVHGFFPGDTDQISETSTTMYDGPSSPKKAGVKSPRLNITSPRLRPLSPLLNLTSPRQANSVGDLKSNREEQKETTEEISEVIEEVELEDANHMTPLGECQMMIPFGVVKNHILNRVDLDIGSVSPWEDNRTRTLIWFIAIDTRTEKITIRESVQTDSTTLLRVTSSGTAGDDILISEVDELEAVSSQECKFSCKARVSRAPKSVCAENATQTVLKGCRKRFSERVHKILAEHQAASEATPAIPVEAKVLKIQSQPAVGVEQRTETDVQRPHATSFKELGSAPKHRLRRSLMSGEGFETPPSLSDTDDSVEEQGAAAGASSAGVNTPGLEEGSTLSPPQPKNDQAKVNGPGHKEKTKSELLVDFLTSPASVYVNAAVLLILLFVLFVMLVRLSFLLSRQSRLLTEAASKMRHR